MNQNSARRQREPIPSIRWCEHFRKNAVADRRIPWLDACRLTESEKHSVAKSIQTFQLGESGQGHHLSRVAAEYSDRSGDAEYREAMQLFIREEQCHGDLLGRFLDLEGVPRIQKQWTNGMFYWLRHRCGLELTISILLTAELIACVYYAALRDATGSRILRRICDSILKDEAAHIRFQTDRLAMLRLRRPRWALRLTTLAGRWFFHGTCLAVWWNHARVFCAGGIGFRKFFTLANRRLDAAQRLMDPAGLVAEGEHYSSKSVIVGPLAGPS